MLNKFNTGSDHRMVRCKVHINVKNERKNMFKGLRCGIDIGKLEVNQNLFQMELKNRFTELKNLTEDIDLKDLNTNITNILIQTATEVAGKQRQVKNDKLSDKTKLLLNKRREMKINVNDVPKKIEYAALCKTVRKCITDDIRKYNCNLVKKSIEENKGIKSVKKHFCCGRKRIFALKAKDGKILKNQEGILKRVEEFYSDLCRDTNNSCLVQNSKSEIPPILKEVQFAVKKMKKGKAPGEDGITADILHEGGEHIEDILTDLFNRCLKQKDVPEDWKNAIIILLHKKGEREDISNYRPISLLSVLYKVFTRILADRLKRSLDEAQPRGQAGFRTGYSTMDHIFVL